MHILTLGRLMRRTSLLALPILLLAVAACDREGAYGDANSIVAAAAPELWAEIEDDVYASLEPTIQTVRDEKAFTVTWTDTGAEEWGNLQKFQQMLLIGREDDPIISEALATVDGRSGFAPPEIVQTYDVWARGQTVTVLLVREGREVEDVRNRLAELASLYDRQYRAYARNRMFISGADTALADTLAMQGRFTMVLPKVYDWGREDSTFVFRNDNPDPAELIRQVAVTWRSPIPPDIQGETLMEWRRELAAAYYTEPQVEDLTDVAAGPFDYQGMPAYQIQAVWKNAPEAEWPAAGPFILRAIVCPAQNRMYLLDAWLYAPGKEKYEYMIQLETILESFSCTLG